MIYDWDARFTNHEGITIPPMMCRITLNDADVSKWDITRAVTGPNGYIETIVKDEDGNCVIEDGYIARRVLTGNVTVELPEGFWSEA